MGRLWKMGDRVRLDKPVIGVVVDVLGGGLTIVEVDGTQDYISADEEYWAKEPWPENYLVLSCGWTGPDWAVNGHRESLRHTNSDPKACAGDIFRE